MSLRNPVKYPVKYYSWQDDQAPQLSNADGLIKTILKACLVTGYGTKQGAGWTALFEDDYRIVLRRPLRTGNPPDIKIENGVINGTASHRIVAQDNPAGLDDTTELSAVNLLAHDPTFKPEWHCIVTDFAFLLCYQMGYNNANIAKNHVLFVGSCQKLNDADSEKFFCSSQANIASNGTVGQQYSLLRPETYFKDMRTGQAVSDKYYLKINDFENYINNDYFAQKIIIGTASVLPFMATVFSNFTDKTSKLISINNRSCLRFVNETMVVDDVPKPLYIPLDYWEL